MIIGIVGGVGCGKSTVLTYLKEKYNAENMDFSNILCTVPNREETRKISAVYSEENVKGELVKLRILFACYIQLNGENGYKDSVAYIPVEKLETLNNITHPGTIKEITDRINNSSNQLVIVESAILIGSGIDKMCDEIWYVYCDLEKRIKRLMDSRGYSEEKTRNVIMNQMSEEEFNRVSDEFIDNSNSEEETHEQIDFILSSQFC